VLEGAAKYLRLRRNSYWRGALPKGGGLCRLNAAFYPSGPLGFERVLNPSPTVKETFFRMSDAQNPNPNEETVDISKQPEAIEGLAAQEERVEVWDAEVQLTDDATSGEPVQSETIIEPLDPHYVPKDETDQPAHDVDELFDCTIIGGGPVGLYGAFYAGLREMKTKIIDSLGELGGQVSALYPEKFIYDVAGFPAVKGKDLIAGCVEQGLQFGPAVCLGEKVEGLVKEEDGTFTLTAEASHGVMHTHRTKTLIVAAGVGAFAPRKLPGAKPELDALEGTELFYFVRDLEVFRDQNILIVGGGDSAMDWAMMLEPLAKSTTLIHRRDKWRAHEDSVKKVLASSVDVRTFVEVKDVQVEGGKIKSAVVFNNKTKEEDTLQVDKIVMCLGFIANIGPIKEWGLEIEAGGIKVDSGSMESNIPGVYAAGDIARYNGKLGLIATGFGEAATAANYAKHHIDPESRVFPGHSSEREGH
jgi:thioredoxin reductase